MCTWCVALASPVHVCMYVYVYLHVYMCVCVCVCICMYCVWSVVTGVPKMRNLGEETKPVCKGMRRTRVAKSSSRAGSGVFFSSKLL